MEIKNGILPSKINPDGIIESVITFKFDTDYSKKKITDTVLGEITNCGKYSVFQEFKKVRRLPRLESEYNQGSVFYSDGNLKLQIEDDSISFNCADKYVGWAAYFEFVSDAINSIRDFCTFTSIELRYISMFEGISILQYIDGKITLNQLPLFAGTELKFGFDVMKNQEKIANARVILTGDKLSRDGKNTASFVDISLRARLNSNADFALERLIDLHNNEKYTFFSLLSEEFFIQRGVEYDR